MMRSHPRFLTYIDSAVQHIWFWRSVSGSDAWGC